MGDGTSDAAMTFTGTVANVNAAWLGSITWAMRTYSGADTLSISVDDQGNTGSGGAKTDSEVDRDHRRGRERRAGPDRPGAQIGQ